MVEQSVPISEKAPEANVVEPCANWRKQAGYTQNPVSECNRDFSTVVAILVVAQSGYSVPV
jgi:hypothetical protein